MRKKSYCTGILVFLLSVLACANAPAQQTEGDTQAAAQKALAKMQDLNSGIKDVSFKLRIYDPDYSSNFDRNSVFFFTAPDKLYVKSKTYMRLYRKTTETTVMNGNELDYMVEYKVKEMKRGVIFPGEANYNMVRRCYLYKLDPEYSMNAGPFAANLPAKFAVNLKEKFEVTGFEQNPKHWSFTVRLKEELLKETMKSVKHSRLPMAFGHVKIKVARADGLPRLIQVWPVKDDEGKKTWRYRFEFTEVKVNTGARPEGGFKIKVPDDVKVKDLRKTSRGRLDKWKTTPLPSPDSEKKETPPYTGKLARLSNTTFVQEPLKKIVKWIVEKHQIDLSLSEAAEEKAGNQVMAFTTQNMYVGDLIKFLAEENNLAVNKAEGKIVLDVKGK